MNSFEDFNLEHHPQGVCRSQTTRKLNKEKTKPILGGDEPRLAA